jgi:hypothetical protein
MNLSRELEIAVLSMPEQVTGNKSCNHVKKHYSTAKREQ